MKHFLSANVYAEAPNQTLSEVNWELRKSAIFIKSAFFQANDERQRQFAFRMEEVCILYAESFTQHSHNYLIIK